MVLHRVKLIFPIEVSTSTLLFCFETWASVCFIFSQAVSTTFFKTSTARISGNSSLHWHKLLTLHSLIIRRYWQDKSNDPLHFLENYIFSWQGKLTSAWGDAHYVAQVSAVSVSHCNVENQILPGSLLWLYLTLSSVSEIWVVWSPSYSTVVFCWQRWTSAGEGLPVRGLLGGRNPCREELWGPQLLVGGELPDESV